MERGNKYVMTVSKRLMEAVGIEEGNTYYAYYKDGLLYIQDSCAAAEEAAFDAGLEEGRKEGMSKGFTGGYRLGFRDAATGREYDETYHGHCGEACDGDCEYCQLYGDR